MLLLLFCLFHSFTQNACCLSSLFDHIILFHVPFCTGPVEDCRQCVKRKSSQDSGADSSERSESSECSFLCNIVEETRNDCYERTKGKSGRILRRDGGHSWRIGVCRTVRIPQRSEEFQGYARVEIAFGGDPQELSEHTILSCTWWESHYK